MCYWLIFISLTNYCGTILVGKHVKDESTCASCASCERVHGLQPAEKVMSQKMEHPYFQNEYGSVFQDPYLKEDINNIDRIQRSATRLPLGPTGPTHQALFRKSSTNSACLVNSSGKMLGTPPCALL